MTSVHPRTGASITAHTSKLIEATDSSAPTRSKRPGAGSRDSGTSHAPAIRATATTGMFTMKIEPHQ